MDNQRQQYHILMEGKQKSPMTQERVQQLEAEGFIWDVYQHTWEQNYELLIQYKEKYGDCNVLSSLEEYKTLKNWVRTQRKQYTAKKNGKTSYLSQERFEALEKIGFIWNLHEDYWNQRFQELVKFKDYHGDWYVHKY